MSVQFATAAAPAIMPPAAIDEIVASSPRDPLARPLLEALVDEYSRRYHDLPGRDANAAAYEVYERYPAEVFDRRTAVSS
jgi:hypothetical protein